MVILITLIVIVAVLLILVILAQNSKGGGLSSQFGGSGASNMIGVKKTGDLLSNITWGLIIVLFALAVSSNFLIEKRTASPTDEFLDRAQENNPGPVLGNEALSPIEDGTEAIDEGNGSLEGLDDLESNDSEEDSE